MKSNYDRRSELKAFDESKAGVKGLVDAGVERSHGYSSMSKVSRTMCQILPVTPSSAFQS